MFAASEEKYLATAVSEELDEDPLFMHDKNGKRVVDMRYFLQKYGETKQEREIRMKEMKLLKPAFYCLNPAAEKFTALPSSNTCSLGFINFKRAKLVSPVEKFMYKKYTKIPTVQLYKKVFTEDPDMIEFAKPEMPVPSWVGDIQQ